MKVQSRRSGTHGVIRKYVAVIALMASGLTVGLAGVAAADNVPTASTVVAAAPTVAANGSATTTITVTLGSNGGATDSVSLVGVNTNSSVIQTGAAGAAFAIPAAGGVAVFSVKDTVGQAVTYQATDVTDGNEVVLQTATVTFEGPVTLTTVASTYTSASATNKTQATATLVNAGDVLVIWIENNVPGGGSAPGSTVSGITKASGTGAIGTAVPAIAHTGTNIPNDFEIWYAPVTTAGTITLNFAWTGNAITTDEIEYTTQEFQPASPASYSLGLTGTSETSPQSTTLTYPTLVATAGQLYAGFNILFAPDGNAPTGTTTGYTAEVAATNDVMIINPDTTAASQSPVTTVDNADISVQSAIAALISARSTAFTVNFNNNGGTGALASESASVATPLSAFSTGTIARTGFTFAGWNTSPLGTGTAYADGASYPFTSSTTLYAQWTGGDTVTFNSEGGTAETAQSGANGSTITLPTPTLAGSTFNGWYTAPTGGTLETSPYTLTATLTLFAQWTANASVTVTFNSEGGTAETAQTGAIGTTITLPTPTLAGSTFNGWYTAPTGGTHETSPYTLATTLTLDAQWTANVTVTFNSEGGTAETAQSGAPGSTITLPTPTLAGSTFNGWYTAPTGGTLETSPYTLATTLTLDAQWTANASVTVTFNSEGGTAETAQTGAIGTTITLPTPTLAGSTFNGWYTAPTGGTLETSPYTLATTLTLDAQWTANVTVTFNSEGGTAETAQSGAPGSTITLPTPTLAGSTFNGWYTAPTGGTLETSPYTLATTLTLDAQWTANVTVTFNSEGGTAETAQSGAPGSTITLPTPTQPGYVFNGWYTLATGGTHVTSPYTLATTLTLFAQWTANASVTVTFNSEGGTAETAQTLPNGSIITLPVPALAGSTFNGWYTAATGGTLETSPYTLTGTLTLYAQWSLNGGGGGGGTPATLSVKATGGTAAFGSVFTPVSTVSAGLGTGDTATVSAATYTYVGTGATTYAASTTAPTAVGTYSVTPSAATVTITPTTDASKYATTYTYVAGTLTITPATLTVTAGNLSITAGGTVTPTVTASGFAGSDGATISGVTYIYAGTGSTTYAASATAPTAAGTYSVTPTAATLAVTPTGDAVDYSTTYTFVAGTLTIAPKPKAPLVPKATHLVGKILPGHRLSVVIEGSGFTVSRRSRERRRASRSVLLRTMERSSRSG